MDREADYDTISSLVKRIFAIEDFTLGSSQQKFIVRYRGHLVMQDSAAAYDQLAESLKPLALTPLFRIENGQQIILIERSGPEPRDGRPMINLIMFILTVISVLVSYGLSTIETMPKNIIQAVLLILKTSWPFAVSLLAILGCHEFGHYFAGRAHGSKISLPFFIPMPFTSIGTMGAFINMKEPPKNKRVLMDIAIAGPIAGYVVSLVVIMIGLSLSKLGRIPMVIGAGRVQEMEGNSITYLLLKYLHFGLLLPQPLNYGNLPPFLYWIKYFFTALPFPYGGLDVMISPVAWAGWVGLLITSLNLIPAGQLDGGHVFYLLFGKNTARKVLPVIILALVGLGFLWSGWWLWAGLVFLFGRVYAEPRDQITQLDRPRKILGVITFIIFFLTFAPIPLTMMLGK
jgi:membrane-associated protease RseP (regulator of RpoE activity)